VVSADQKHLFVSLAGDGHGKNFGVAVLDDDEGKVALRRVESLDVHPTGIVLTHDGKVLIAACGDAVVLFDTAKLIDGLKDPEIARFSDGPDAGSVYVNVTADDQTLFVSDEQMGKITVVDLAKIRLIGFTPAAIVGKIPTGRAPIALTFSPDEKWLYTTCEIAAPEWNWPKTITREGPPDGKTRPLVPEGAVVVVDVAKAKSDPAHAVETRVPAGGSAVRLAISPSGDRVYVTARNSNALQVFDAVKLREDPEHAKLAAIAVGSGPVPVLVAEGGKRIFVGNSNRFGQDRDVLSTATVIDATKITSGAGAVLGTIRTGAFPREFILAPDGRTIFLTNFLSRTLQVIDAHALKISK
jgi:DNA-binding beta-propeller fold protein YncE